MNNAQLCEILGIMLPVIKIAPGKYLIGTQVKQLQKKEKNLILRVGGGYTDLDTYFKEQLIKESITILKIMEDR